MYFFRIQISLPLKMFWGTPNEAGSKSRTKSTPDILMLSQVTTVNYASMTFDCVSLVTT